MACFREEVQEEYTEVGSVYLHIGNGGVVISVEDHGYGPQLSIESSHFGNNLNSQKILVSPNELVALARLFDHAASHHGYSEAYCHAAKIESSVPNSLSEGFRPDRGSGCCGGGCHKE